MSDRRRSDDETQRAMLVIAALVGTPIALVFLIEWITKSLGPFLWLILFVAAASAGAYAWFRFRTSLPSGRRDHEAEMLAFRQRAEEQQRSLPARIEAAALERALVSRDFVADANLISTLAALATRIFAIEFLAPLSSMPIIPLEAEKVYDVDYDRRALKKGEEPPHRVRTDARGRPTSLELLAYEEWIHRYLASTTNPQATLTLFTDGFAEMVIAALSGVPLGGRGRAMLSVPLIDLVADSRHVVARVISVAYQRRLAQWHHFGTVRTRYEQNRGTVSASTLRLRDLDAGVLLDVQDFQGTGREAIDLYLKDSPLRDLFLIEVPFEIPAEKRFEGELIVARQGSGKTNALECLIYNDLAEVAAGRSSVVVMDSQGLSRDALIGRLARIDYFRKGGPLEDKLIYLEPDIDSPLALNIFDIGLRDIHTMSTREREAIVGSACDVIEFLFTGLLGGDLSDNMTMLYRYLVPAMLAIPAADMNTFIELLDTGAERGAPPAWLGKYQRHLVHLDPAIRSFLETDFLRDPELIKTKAAVRRRLRAALADTNFRRMFTQPRNKLDLYSELQAGKVVLVNTFAAGNYVEQFGRLFLALLMQATHRRLALDREQRLPTFVYLDECQDYIAREERIARYIDKCRKQNVGLVFATQRLATIESPRVLNALKGTPIKLAGGSDADADELASLLDTTPDHIRALPRGRFTAHVSGVTAHGVDVTFPRSPLETLPQVNADQFEAMRQEMRDRYAVSYQSETAPVYGDFDETRAVPTPQLAAPENRRQDANDQRSADDEDYDPLR